MVDHYRVLRRIGRGGMGEVYVARDTRLGRRVALKVIRAGALSEDSIERFFEEAKITARFNHPHIVTIFGVGSTSAGDGVQASPYIALEYLEGRSLRDVLATRMPFRESLRFTLAIAEALAEAHANGILHRDLKPENVMIPIDGRLRVVDFGIATIRADLSPAAADSPASSALQSVEQSVPSDSTVRLPHVIGTPLYMAPEQWRGDALTAAVDIWALGLTMHEMFRGVHPFAELSALRLGLGVACGELTAAFPADVDSELHPIAELAAQCLSHAPEARPSAAEVAARIDSLLHGRSSVKSESQAPFRGLFAYTEAQAELFFGRDREITTFVERARSQALLPIVGASGAGKSSFIQAGVIPRLREQRDWTVVSMRPGRDPFGALAARLLAATTTTKDTPAGRPSADDRSALRALRDELLATPGLLGMRLRDTAANLGVQVLLVVDQLEELMTHVDNPEIQRSFMQALAMAADDPNDPVRVVFTLRDDFLGRLADVPEAPQALVGLTVLKTPAADALEEFLESTVASAGYAFEGAGDERLAAIMVSAVRNEPAALALLQIVGAELWEKRDRSRKLLLRTAFDELGGVEGSLVRHANAVLDGLDADGIAMCRAILLRLVTDDGTRRVVPRQTLLDGLPEGAASTLDHLVSARALVVRKGAMGAPEVEIVHESLLVSWPRLRHWMEESREDLNFISEARRAAELWEKRGKLEGETWEGDALLEGLRRAKRTRDLPRQITEFLAAGERRFRRRRALRRGGIGAALALLVGIAITAIVVAAAMRRKERDASEQRDAANAQRQVAMRQKAEALAEGARSSRASGDFIAFRAKLRTALETDDSFEARAAWLEAHDDARLAAVRLPQIGEVAYSPTGDVLAVGSYDGRVVCMDSESGKELSVRRGDGSFISALAFSPDGNNLVVGLGDSGAVDLWNRETNASRPLVGHRNFVGGACFLPNGERIATASLDGSVRLWSTTSGELVAQASYPFARSVACDPTGRYLAVGTREQGVSILRTSDLSEVKRLPVEKSTYRIVFSADGRSLVTAGESVNRWAVDTGEHLRRYAAFDGDNWGVALSPDGRWMAEGGEDGYLRLFDVASGSELQASHLAYRVAAVAFSPDGARLAVGTATSEQGTPTLFVFSSPLLERAPSRQPIDEQAGALSRDGKLVAFVSKERDVELWDAMDATFVRGLGAVDSPVVDMRFSPDGSSLALAQADGTIGAFPLGGPDRSFTSFGRHRSRAVEIAFSPNGELLASAGSDNALGIWDTKKRSMRGMSTGRPMSIGSVAFRAEEVLTSTDAWATIWDVHGHQLGEHKFDSTLNATRWLGDIIAGGDQTGTIHLWDRAKDDVRSVSASSLTGKDCGAILFMQALDASHLVFGCSSGDDAYVVDTHAMQRVRRLRNAGNLAVEGNRLFTSGAEGFEIWDAPRQVPRWRGPALLRSSRELATGRGWSPLDSGAPPQLPTRLAPRWRRALVGAARIARESDDGRSLCAIGYDDDVTLWDKLGDAELANSHVGDAMDLRMVGDECWVTASDGQLRAFGPGAERRLMDDVRAIDSDGDEALVVTATAASRVARDGTILSSCPAEAGATAVGHVESSIIVGYADGAVEACAPEQNAARITFEDAPSSAVRMIVGGPAATLIAGFADGTIVVWSTSTGAELVRRKIHGVVQHLLVDDDVLYAASDRGASMAVDLSPLTKPYCDLLHDVWRDVGIGWVNGSAERQAVPAKHRCFNAP